MGLSSSQARLLNLTARMHQIEYKAAKLEAEKLQMANESRRVYDTYLAALDATKIQVRGINTDGSVKWDDATTALLNGVHLTLVAPDGDYPDPSTFTLNATTLANLLNAGYYLSDGNPYSDTAGNTSVATNPNLQEVSDETNLKKAEAQYEADMKKIDMKDRHFDTQLAALDAERNAIKSEMETLKTVAKDNVERTFKLFS
ncbi:MAG: hypothetical protein K6E29_03550 [Cyanobacteria bacterium RUI128]|nr:hypothetical protein [Cyanobacteria bacterium RUI128]